MDMIPKSLIDIATLKKEEHQLKVMSIQEGIPPTEILKQLRRQSGGGRQKINYQRAL